jgi:hypothetical protein
VSYALQRYPPLSEVNSAAWPKEEARFSDSMGYMPTDMKCYGSGSRSCAEWRLQAFTRHDPPCEGEDNLAGHPRTELRYLEKYQAVSFLLRQESGGRSQRGYEGQNYLMIPMQNMSMEMRMIRFAAFPSCVLAVVGNICPTHSLSGI